MSYAARLALGTAHQAMQLADAKVEAARRDRDAKRHHVAHVRAAVVAVLYRAHPEPLDRRQILDALHEMKLSITRQGLDRHLTDLQDARVVTEFERLRVREARGGYPPMTFVLTADFLDRAAQREA